MRSFVVRALPIVAVALIITPLLAQPPGGFGRGQFMTISFLVQNKGVQEELKLTEDQVTKITKISTDTREKYKDDLAKAREGKDFAKIGELNKKIGEETEKALSAGDLLKPDQLKRVKQIRLQNLGLAAFLEEAVAKELKLTDKQKEEIKALDEDLTKDRRELMKDVGKDQKKREEAQKKIAELTTETMAKVQKTFSDDQKKTWKEMTGTKYEVKFEFTRPGKDKAKDK
jgi:Spy/CpxP family protein refolding chaperone